MVMAWRPSEVQGYISRYFQNNISETKSPYSHLSLLVCDEGYWLMAEACIDEVYFSYINLEELLKEEGHRVDLYEFANVYLTREQLLANIEHITYNSIPTTYATLYRALIGFERHGGTACTSYVLDCLGIHTSSYLTVFEALEVISFFYPLLDLYSG